MPKCGKCGKVFTTQQQLKVHKYAKHGGPWPFGPTKKPGPKKKCK